MHRWTRVFFINTDVVCYRKLMKGKALRKHSLHEKTAASVLLKFIDLRLLCLPVRGQGMVTRAGNCAQPLCLYGLDSTSPELVQTGQRVGQWLWFVLCDWHRLLHSTLSVCSLPDDQDNHGHCFRRIVWILVCCWDCNNIYSIFFLSTNKHLGMLIFYCKKQLKTTLFTF